MQLSVFEILQDVDYSGKRLMIGMSGGINSAAAAQCYAAETEMDGHWHNEIHAMDYLVYAYLQKGDNAKAKEQYEHLQTIHKDIQH